MPGTCAVCSCIFIGLQYAHFCVHTYVLYTSVQWHIHSWSSVILGLCTHVALHVAATLCIHEAWTGRKSLCICAEISVQGRRKGGGRGVFSSTQLCLCAAGKESTGLASGSVADTTAWQVVVSPSAPSGEAVQYSELPGCLRRIYSVRNQ